LCTNGGALLSEDNKTCLLDSPEAIETLEFIMELHKYAAPGSVSRHWDESGAILGQGVIATDIIINSQASNLYNPEKSNFVDELLFAPIPYKKNHGSISNTWGGAIMSNSKNKEAAFIALQYLTMPDLSKSMVTDVSGTTPVRMSLLEDQALIAEIPALKVEAEVIDACVSKPKVDTMAAITTIVASEIQNAINGVKTAEQAMKDAKALVEAEL
ncbi:MAG: extracellular solute-binding protein, partial [Oscillospiraceae bacterium]|nr:extracellular solute-binding protein [Oscillospiraceae bacterium]